MIKYILLISILIGFENCSSQENTNDKENNNAQLSLNIESSIDQQYLVGVWWISREDPHALFQIIGDSLYYVDSDLEFQVSIRNDSMIWVSQEEVSIFKLNQLTKDTLRFFDSNIEEEIVLFKKN